MKKIFLTILFYFIFIGISLAEQKWINNLPGPSSPEIIDCLKSSIGEKNLEKYFGSKKRQRPSTKHEGMMRKCFESAQKIKSGEQQNQQSNSTDWTKNLPGPPTTPEIINCLKSSIGEKNLEKYFGSKKRQRPTPEDENKLRKCFDQTQKQGMQKQDKMDQAQSNQSSPMNMDCVPEGKSINRIENEHIVGVIGPSLWEWSRNNSFKDAKAIKETGSTTVGFGLTIFIDKKGKLAFGKDGGPQLEQWLCLVGSSLKEANDNGLATYLAINPQIMTKTRGVEKSKLTGKQREVFLKELENILPMLSKFAERHGVKYFTPLAEPEKRVGPKLAVSWMPKGLKIIKPYYNGLTVWQTADDYYKGKFPKFKGYDMVGLVVLIGGSNLSEINQYYSERKKELSKLHKALIASDINKFFVAEFGFMVRPKIKDDIASKLYYKFLDLAAPYSDNVLFLENPSDMKMGTPQQVKGTFIEDIIKKLSK